MKAWDYPLPKDPPQKRVFQQVHCYASVAAASNENCNKAGWLIHVTYWMGNIGQMPTAALAAYYCIIRPIQEKSYHLQNFSYAPMLRLSILLKKKYLQGIP